MSACYSVTLKVKVLDEKGAIEALKNHIDNDKRTYYNLEKYKERGITTETFDDLMKIFLADYPRQEVDITKGKLYTCYSNDFNASYGWESVMMEMFETITPFIKDNSSLLIYPDSDYDELVVKDGKCVQIH